MLGILFGWLSIPRTIGIWIDSIAYGLIDNVYNLIDVLASHTLFNEKAIVTIMNNTYIVISIFALFRIALILVNTIINPDKLTDKENGIGSVLRNLIIMFVLLIFTPMLFNEAYSIQEKVVGNHYVSKIFSGSNVTSSGNPGKTMQRVAVSALIHPDERLSSQIKDGDKAGQYEGNSECGSKCKDAIQEYNDYVLTGDDKLWSTLSKNIGKTEKVGKTEKDSEGETVYVYTYMFVVNLIAGVFITYVLISMAIDIAVRSVELAILQIISPLFIATYIDPKSAKSGPFHNWLKMVGKTYSSLFIKLAILELMIIFIGLIDTIDLEGLGLFGKVIILLAVLIFAKKAPKWIGEMIGVDGESSGIGGLGKKLGSAALVGGALTAAGHAAAGALTGGVKAIHNNAKDRRARRKKIRKDEGLTHFKAGHETRKGYGGSYFNQRKQLHQARKQAYENGNIAAKNNISKLGSSAGMGLILGAQAGFKAENLKGAFSGGIKSADDFASRMNMQNNSGIFDNIGKKIKKLPGKMERAYGSSNELFDEKEILDKKKKAAEFTENGDYGKQDYGLGLNKIAVGKKDANTICDAVIKNFDKMGELNDASYAAAQYALNRGYAKINDSGEISLSNVKFNEKDKIFEFTNASGNTEKISVESLEKNMGGILDSSSLGPVSCSEMVNSYKTTALNNYQQNEQTRAQEISSYQTARAESSNIQNQLQADLSNFALANAGLMALNFDTSSIEKLKESFEKASDNIKREISKLGNDSTSEDLKKELRKLDKDLLDQKKNAEEKMEKKNNFDMAAQMNYDNIKELVKAQTELKIVVDAVDGDTMSEKINTLSINEKKISDKKEALSKKDEEKK